MYSACKSKAREHKYSFFFFHFVVVVVVVLVVVIIIIIVFIISITGSVRVLENLESPGILLWHFPGLESPGKRSLVLESSGNLLNSAKNTKCMEGSKEN